MKEATGAFEARSRTETTPSERPTARKREAGESDTDRMWAVDGGLGEISPNAARVGGVRKVSEARLDATRRLPVGNQETAVGGGCGRASEWG